MIAPALGKMDKDLGVTFEVEAQMTFSIFVLAYAMIHLNLWPVLCPTAEQYVVE